MQDRSWAEVLSLKLALFTSIIEMCISPIKDDFILFSIHRLGNDLRDSMELQYDLVSSSVMQWVILHRVHVNELVSPVNVAFPIKDTSPIKSDSMRFSIYFRVEPFISIRCTLIDNKVILYIFSMVFNRSCNYFLTLILTSPNGALILTVHSFWWWKNLNFYQNANHDHFCHYHLLD